MLILLISGCQPPPPLDQQVYIWQRQWRPSHEQALTASRQDFSALRVLALQYHPQAGWSESRPDLPLLERDGRPLIAVARVDGQLDERSRRQIGERLLTIVQRWQQAGLQVQGVEIDHDCASRSLADYRQMLQRLRQQLPSALGLSITALPSWLDSKELAPLLASVDHSVLQVHAVSAPDGGLFNQPQAELWIRRWSDISPTPFFVALPAYSVALITTADGAPLVESEVALNHNGPRQELRAEPVALASLVDHLTSDRPPGLVGLIWFRLPLADDRRSWPLSTLLAVVRQQSLAAKPVVELQQQGDLGQLTLYNGGNAPLPLPATIHIPAQGCSAADGLVHYRLALGADQIEAQQRRDASLAAGQRLPLGWARCQQFNQQGTAFGH